MSDNLPKAERKRSEFEGEGKGVLTLLKEVGLAPSNSEARRSVEQGGVSINGEKITDPKTAIREDAVKEDGSLILRKGKKKVIKVVLK